MTPFFSLDEIVRLPHLLIGGAIGQGGRQYLLDQTNELSTNNEISLVILDPGVIWFSDFDGSPHLAIPRAKSTDECSTALDWVKDEIDRRLCTPPSDTEKLSCIIVAIDQIEDIVTPVYDKLRRILLLGGDVGVHVIANIHAGSINSMPDDMLSAFPARIAFLCATREESISLIGIPHAVNSYPFCEFFINNAGKIQKFQLRLSRNKNELET